MLAAQTEDPIVPTVNVLSRTSLIDILFYVNSCIPHVFTYLYVQVLAAQAGDHGMSIVNVSSQASQAALSDHLVYGATKAALDQVTRVMALELGPKNVSIPLLLY